MHHHLLVVLDCMLVEHTQEEVLADVHNAAAAAAVGVAAPPERAWGLLLST